MKRMKRFSLQLLSRWQELREGQRNRISTHLSDRFQLRRKPEGRQRDGLCIGSTRRKRNGWRKRTTGHRDRRTGAPTYILMTQAATPSIPLLWHHTNKAWWHTHTHTAAVSSTRLYLSALTGTSILWPVETARGRTDADTPTHVMPHRHENSHVHVPKYGTRKDKTPACHLPQTHTVL